MLRAMYLPAEFRARDPLALVSEFPFATLIALPSGEATHVPLLLADTGTLVGHVARASMLAREILAGTELLAIFSGPHAYVSPFDYHPEGRDPAQHVPTWNYVAAHVRGRARALTTEAEAREVLARLAQRFDARGWTDGGLADGYRQSLLRGIVTFELRIEAIEGKKKLGQNRTSVERLCAASALEQRPTETEREVGRRMRSAGHSRT